MNKNRKVNVRFLHGFIQLVVPFWTPYDYIVRDARNVMNFASPVMYISDEDGNILKDYRQEKSCAA